MKKEIWLMVIMAVIIVALIAVFAFVPAKPKGPKIVGGEVLAGNSDFKIFSLNGDALASGYSSPLMITGAVYGNGWTGFEGQVGTVKLLDYKGNLLTQTYLAATTEWTKLPTNFEATINFNTGYSGPATLVFHNENPSGDPARDKTFTLPVTLVPNAETMTIKAFFAKNEITGSTCSVVFPVDRVVPKTTGVAKAALEELLKGPTDAEKATGYYSNINSGVKIQGLTIDTAGTAKVDFSSQLETTGGSCKVTEIRSEINFTLKQFPTIKNVVISINGNSETILQP